AEALWIVLHAQLVTARLLSAPAGARSACRGTRFLHHMVYNPGSPAVVMTKKRAACYSRRHAAHTLVGLSIDSADYPDTAHRYGDSDQCTDRPAPRSLSSLPTGCPSRA